MKTGPITQELKIELDIKWWVRHFMRSGHLWYVITRRTPDYDRLTNFCVKYGMKLKVEKYAA